MKNIFRNKKYKNDETYYYYVIYDKNDNIYNGTYTSYKGYFDFQEVFKHYYNKGVFNIYVNYWKEISKEEVDSYHGVDWNMTERKWKTLQREQQINSILEN